MGKKKKPLNCQKLDVVITAQMEIERYEDISMINQSVENAIDELRQYGVADAEIKGDLNFKISKSI